MYDKYITMVNTFLKYIEEEHRNTKQVAVVEQTFFLVKTGEWIKDL